MARPLRIAYQGAFYHVMSRGIEGREIYKDDKDCERFLRILERAASRYRVCFHAYVLMPNHYHLALETPEGNISKTMHFINVAFTQYFNRKHQRCGYLFQGRFKALLIQKENYLVTLSRYIHQNPVRAEIVAKPEDYPFSSYRSFLGFTQKPVWLNIADTLSYFGNQFSSQQKNYQVFVNAELQENLLERAMGKLILGTEKFIKKIKEDIKEKISDHQEYSQKEELKFREDPEKIFDVVCKAYNINRAELMEGRWKRLEARLVGMYLLREMAGFSLKEIGEYFGINYPGVAWNINQIDQRLDSDRDFNKKFGQIKRILNGKL